MARNKKKAQWSELFREGPGSSSKHGDGSPKFEDDLKIEEEDNRSSSSSSFEEGQTYTSKEIREILKLQASDHPGMQLVSDQLTGNNFYQWSRSVKRALGTRGKLEFLDGSFPEPGPHSKYYKAWLKTDYMISNWITNSISKELVNAFNHHDTTQKLWESLNRKLGRSNGPKVYKLQKEIFGYRQGEQDVLMYFNNLTALWSELDMLLPGINCMCDAEKVYEERIG